MSKHREVVIQEGTRVEPGIPGSGESIPGTPERRYRVYRWQIREGLRAVCTSGVYSDLSVCHAALDWLRENHPDWEWMEIQRDPVSSDF